MNFLLYLIAIFSLSQASNLIKFTQAPPEVIGVWRLLGASIILFILFCFKKNYKLILQNIYQNKMTVLITGVLFFFHLWSYFYAAQNTKIANCMILFATNPLYTAIGSFVFFKEKLTINVLIAYGLAFFGIYFLVSNTVSFNPENLKGEVSALISAFFYSAYTLSSKHSRTRLDNSDFSIGIYFVCGLCFLILANIQSTQLIDYPQHTWIGILGTILIPTLLGHALFTYLMNYLNINWMSCGKLLEPGLSAMMAFFIFNEKISSSTQIAFLFTTLAVIVLFLPKLISRKDGQI